MHAIAFVTQKGGAGKSTLAACLAVAAQEAGERVFLVDMDPQGSLLSWGQSRDAETPLVDTITPVKLDTALATLAGNGYTLAMIDTAGADTAAAAAAMRAADLCLIPARPTAFDIRATEKTRDALKTLSREYAFILNQCPPGPRSSRAHDGARALELMGGLVTPMIASRVDYQTAAVTGQGVTELNPQGKAAEEMRELWASVKRRLGVRKHGKAARVA
jgi:chromosome partitioning protein